MPGEHVEKHAGPSAQRGLFGGGSSYADRVYSEERQAGEAQLAKVVQGMRPRWPKLAEVLALAEHNIVAHIGFQREHWTRSLGLPVWGPEQGGEATREPGGAAPPQGIGGSGADAVLLKIADEWQLGRSHFSLEAVAGLSSRIPRWVSGQVRFSWHRFAEARDWDFLQCVQAHANAAH